MRGPVVSSKQNRRIRRTSRGFTLAELMVVVTILGILSVLGIATLRKYQNDAKNVEGLATIQAISAAQERYRAEHLTYLDVSSTLTTFYPMATPSQTKTTWRQTSGNNQANWNRLAVPYNGLVQYGYATKAGLPMPSSSLPSGLGLTLVWPTNLTEPWFIVQAKGDLDADGTPSWVVRTSLSGAVYQTDAGE